MRDKKDTSTLKFDRLCIVCSVPYALVTDALGQRHPSSSRFVAEEEGEAAVACSVVTAVTRLDLYGATKNRDVLGSLESGDF